MDSCFRRNDRVCFIIQRILIMHSFPPQSILISLGPFVIHWYGFFVVAGFVVGLWLSNKLASQRQIKKDLILDLGFWLIIFGIIGGRFYHVANEWNYYYNHFFEIFYFWRGGLAIHGGILAGVIFLIIFLKRKKISFWKVADILVPGLILGQAIGRWGNYFNQELFGKPCDFSWCIFIEQLNRPVGFESFSNFHPAFLYEFFWNLLVLAILLIIFKKGKRDGLVFINYLFWYSLGRFLIELLRIDQMPEFLGLRLAGWVSLGLMIVGVGIGWYLLKLKNATFK